MNYQDQLETQRTNAKNAVEEYVYNMRDKLESTLNDFITEDAKESFRSFLASTEDWLYEDGEVCCLCCVISQPCRNYSFR